ncbi:MAG TPA: hypothetical protein VL134_11340 [Leptolyngbya sp.]|nr:hypothetical protein [Leptolyngbya sp.]
MGSPLKDVSNFKVFHSWRIEGLSGFPQAVYRGSSILGWITNFAQRQITEIPCQATERSMKQRLSPFSAAWV